MLDLLIKNVLVVDGSGKKAFLANVGVKNGKISCVGQVDLPAKEVIVCEDGSILAPGFFDLHGHNDTYRLADPLLTHLLLQGVTGEVSGNCGYSQAPLSEKYGEIYKEITSAVAYKLENPPALTTFKSYLDAVEALHSPYYFGTLVGHNAIRAAVMGLENRKATPEEVEQMCELTRDAMEEGALGLSTGLIYVPGIYGDYEEIEAMLRVVGEYGGFHATHMRNEDEHSLESLAATIGMCKRTGCRLVISHHKIMGWENAHLYKETLRMMDEARAEGLEIICDQYQYNAGASKMEALLPPSLQAGGHDFIRTTWAKPEERAAIIDQMENDHSYSNLYALGDGTGSHIQVLYCGVTTQHIGKFINEIAAEMGVTPVEALMQILLDNDFNALMTIYYCNSDVVEGILKYPYTVAGSDGAMTNSGMTHPRTYGEHAHLYQEYVREKGVLTLEEFVRKASTITADFLRLNKGHIGQGYDADMVIFDPKTYGIKTSYTAPAQKPTGVKYVFLGGKVAVRDGEVVMKL